MSNEMKKIGQVELTLNNNRSTLGSCSKKWNSSDLTSFSYILKWKAWIVKDHFVIEPLTTVQLLREPEGFDWLKNIRDF